MKLPKVYEPGQYEADIYQLWEQSGAFQPSGKGDSFSQVMPPPNANANLHIGYELTAAIEDTVARYQRLRGKSVLLLPGADHAGFETQSVYEKHLAKEGKSRFDFTRDVLYQQIWDFVALNRGNFIDQMRRMGVSCDWDKFTFTLDDKIVSRAYQTFQKMWDEGLIYRGERLVNYCTFHGTAFADIEVIHKEDKGHLWYLKYPLVDGSGELIVATTRPETMLGDTGVAVHPDDERYQQFIGKTVKLPLTGREVPVIGDEFVDTSFGTGAVKLTPAHDQNDYDAAQRHSLPLVQVINTEGKLTADVPEQYRGLTVQEARKAVVQDLTEQGALDKTEDYTHNVGHCYKCDTVIEPLLMAQWFVKMAPLAEPAIQALEQGKVSFYPEAKRDQLIGYLKGIHDWNISRQIAWGIPIPAFQNVDEPDDWIFDTRVDQEIIEVDGKTYHRDADVFDTWFSSSSWPYATLDYPDSADFKQHYPLSLMETGGEILYPWVSRMLMLGLYVTGEVPFREVYIHGYVMAEDGSKMSKSIGNVVDPLPVIEQYGSDALRMGILDGRVPAVNRGYDPRKVENARNFCNKLWNIARYIEGVLGDNFKLAKPHPQSLADHWVLSKLQQAQSDIEDDMANYRLAEAYDKLYHLVWDDVADWYIEASKSELNPALLAHVLESVLIMLHPFAPFVTETIWQTLVPIHSSSDESEHSIAAPAQPAASSTYRPDTPAATSGQSGTASEHSSGRQKTSKQELSREKDSLLINRRWPKLAKVDQSRAADFDELKVIVSEARLIIKSLGASQVTLYYTDVNFLRDNADLIKRLAGLKAVTEVSAGNGLYLTDSKYKCWLDIDSDTARQYAAKLKDKQDELKSRLDGLQERLSDKNYTERAPKHIVDDTKRQVDEAENQLTKLQAEIDRFTA